MQEAFDFNDYKKLRDQNPTFRSPEYSVLLDYEIQVENEILYQNRKKYQSIIENFFETEEDKMVLLCAFMANFKRDQKRVDAILNDDEKLSNFQLNSKSEGFSRLLCDIFTLCDSITDQDFDEIKFNKLLKESYSELLKFID